MSNSCAIDVVPQIINIFNHVIHVLHLRDKMSYELIQYKTVNIEDNMRDKNNAWIKHWVLKLIAEEDDEEKEMMVEEY